VNCPLTDEGLSIMREDFLASPQPLLYKIRSADQLMAQQPINQSLVAAAMNIGHAVLYFCTIPPNLTLVGNELEVR
jgi:hypothetical protein